MLRDPKDIEQEISDFFENKNIVCNVDTTGILSIKVSLLKDEKEHKFKIRNRFFDRKDSDGHLNKILINEHQKLLAYIERD